MRVNENKPAKQADSLRALIQKNTDMFKMALPKTITPERMTRIAMTAVTKNPALANCSQQSFFGALLTAAQLGLEPNTPLGQAYLIPYNTKHGMSCQFQIGYQGILDLAYRSGKYKRIKAVVVHDGDDFSYAYGLNAVLSHIPNGTGLPTHVYALYELTNGGIDFEVWTWEQILSHAQSYSQSYNAKESPWKTAPEEMAKKTVLKSLLKYAPKTVELAEATQSDGGIIEKKLMRNEDNYEIITDVQYDTIESSEPEQGTPIVAKDVKTIPGENVKQESNKQTLSEDEESHLDSLFEEQNIGPEFPM